MNLIRKKLCMSMNVWGRVSPRIVLHNRTRRSGWKLFRVLEIVTSVIFLAVSSSDVT